MQHRAGRFLYIHSRQPWVIFLDACHQLCFRIADIDLTTGNVEGPPVQRERLRQPGDRVFCRGVADGVFTWRVSGNGTVIYNAPTLR